MGGWHRLASDDDFQIRQVLLVRARFCSWARWARFFMAKKSIIGNTIHLYLFYLFSVDRGGRNGWVA